MQTLDSLAASLASLPTPARAKILASLSPNDRRRLHYVWEFWARPKQLAPEGDWRTWLVLAGRGFGKTRTGAERVRQKVERLGSRRIALVGPTASDVRDVMIEGESGILAISPPWNRPKYEPSRRRLTWPNGAIATAYSAEEPDRLRGPQHDDAWADELAAWPFDEAWDNLMMGLRLGTNPQAVVTTTPRPTKLIRDVIADLHTRKTTGSTYENKTNLAPAFLTQILTKYEGTRIGRQELYAELLDDTPGALWRRQQIEDLRVRKAPELVRIVVAIDPAASDNPDSAETGIVVAGLGEDGHGYILDDLSDQGSPGEWANRAVNAYDTHGADRIIGEANNGGDMVEHTVRTVRKNIPFRAVHASRGKRARAEPIAALYEQKKVHHVGAFPVLEDQLCTWDASSGARSPDRLDANVWALTELMLGENFDDGEVIRVRSDRH